MEGHVFVTCVMKSCRLHRGSTCWDQKERQWWSQKRQSSFEGDINQSLKCVIARVLVQEFNDLTSEWEIGFRKLYCLPCWKRDSVILRWCASNKSWLTKRSTQVITAVSQGGTLQMHDLVWELLRERTQISGFIELMVALEISGKNSDLITEERNDLFDLPC